MTFFRSGWAPFGMLGAVLLVLPSAAAIPEALARVATRDHLDVAPKNHHSFYIRTVIY